MVPVHTDLGGMAWQPVVRRWLPLHCPLVTCMMELAAKVSVVAE